jgi:hypothetical protein
MNAVRNMAILKGMQKANLITFTTETGCKIGKSIIYYINDRCDNVMSVFTYKGVKYTLKYFSGCFYPYVCYYTE